jgi:hypothetical protein
MIEEVLCLDPSSIGGCPLEEASDEEWIPSLKGSIVWCFPNLRVLVIINNGVFLSGSHIFFV